MKETLVAGAIIVALTGYVGYSAIYQGQVNEQAQIAAELEQLQGDQRTQEHVGKLLEQIEQYRTRLSPTTEPEWLIDHIVRLTDEAGVRVTTITPEPPKAVGGFTRLTAVIDLEASYHEFGTLLDYLEQARHFLWVDRLEVDAGSAAAEPVEGHPLRFRLALSTLHVPPLVAGGT